MALDAQKYRAALMELEPKEVVFADPPADFRAWLAGTNLPDVVEFLLQTAVVENVPFPSGSGGMWAPRDIMVLNDQESDILAGGLLAVGNSTNGDFIVIDLRDEQRQSGYVSHDELWEGESSWTGVREIFAPVADSLDEMLTQLSATLWRYLRDEEQACEFPCDYFEAITRKSS